MSRSKAQVEFIAVLIFLILIVVIAYTSFFKPETDVGMPSAVKRKMNAISDYFTGMAGRVSGEMISEIEYQGGYDYASKAPGGNVTFLGGPVPVWQRCGRSFIPPKEDLEKTIASKMEDYIKTHGPEATEVFGEQVSFDFSKLDVTAKIRESDVDISIDLPTSVGKYPVREPYKISYPTSLGRIYSFASDFSRSQGENRYFENFLLASIYLSREDELPLLPTFDIMTSGVIFRSSESLTENLAQTINHSITNILLWQGMSDQSGDRNPKAFSIQSVSGKQYPDLNPPGPSDGIEFLMPDGFSINITEDFQWVADGKFIESVECDKFTYESHYLTSYNLDYNITYPIVVRMFDPILGSHFQFAVLASIDDDMQPGGC